MDFGYAHGNDNHIANLRLMFERMPNTRLINVRGVSSLRQFIAHLSGTPAITKPVGDLVLGSHANNEGELFLSAFPGQTTATTYETLEDTLSNAARSIKIPDPLIGFQAGNPPTHAVHLKGCNIGKALPFLTKLKEALGGNVKVTAPKFFHGATPARGQGVFEYLGYEFTLRRATRFPSRAVALAEFDAAQFPLIKPNTVVPTADWNTLVPANPNTSRAQQFASPLGVTIGSRTTLLTPRQYRVMPVTFGPWTVPFPNPAAVPKDQSTQLSELEIHLKTHPRFQATHPFPQYEREGFANVIEFVSGYTWNCARVGANLVCNGTRLLYIAALAVTDPATTPASGFFGDGNLIFNFYPNAGVGLSAITTGVRVTDPRFFVTVT